MKTFMMMVVTMTMVMMMIDDDDGDHDYGGDDDDHGDHDDDDSFGLLEAFFHEKRSPIKVLPGSQIAWFTFYELL